MKGRAGLRSQWLVMAMDELRKAGCAVDDATSHSPVPMRYRG